MSEPIVILGGGINGVAIARELLLTGLPVWLIDQGDVCSGATAYSSRLIHGGLRYLEFGEFSLVSESLRERNLLLKLAPQFVRPLRLFIPVKNRTGGWFSSASRFLHLPIQTKATDRGLWLVSAGLKFYDQYARDKTLPKHDVLDNGSPNTPPVNADDYRWLCSYYDGQISFPERFVQAMLHDTRTLAKEQNLEFRLLTYHTTRREENELVISPNRDFEVKSDEQQPDNPIRIKPAVVINATGAWVDETLKKLPVSADRLMGGTKGSHLFTFHEPLRKALSSGGIYTEASDGRPVFLLPHTSGVLIGTTDIPFTGDPATAVADETEIAYLVKCVQHVLPEADFKPEHIAWHYSGVRPLPYVDAKSTAGITRSHKIEPQQGLPFPMLSIIGGKLTTCRSLAEEVWNALLIFYVDTQPEDFASTLRHNPDPPLSQTRCLPGADDYPENESSLLAEQQTLADSCGLTLDQVRALWALWGTLSKDVAKACVNSLSESLPGTDLPTGAVHWCVEQEQPQTLEDLIERRFMLIYSPGFSLETVEALADAFIATGCLKSDNRDQAIESATKRLHDHFGLKLN